MKKYMIVYTDDEGCPSAAFADDYSKAKQIKQDAECGLGGYAEIYGREEREDDISEYIFLES